jgi:hypothetical protein
VLRWRGATLDGMCGKWVEIAITAVALYQHLLLGKKFWRCVESGEPLAYSGSSRRGLA